MSKDIGMIMGELGNTTKYGIKGLGERLRNLIITILSIPVSLLGLLLITIGLTLSILLILMLSPIYLFWVLTR